MLYTAGMNGVLRDVEDRDVSDVLALNQASVPAVNALGQDDIAWFRRHAAYFRVAVHDSVFCGFLIGLGPGTDYTSPNYRWFSDHFEDFGYIDRVAVMPDRRGSGIARRLYEDFAASLPPSATMLTCEVNIEPPNEPSLDFHRRLGFTEVGTQRTEGGTKRVVLLARPR